MRKIAQSSSSLLMAAVFLALAWISGCAARGSVRYYDPVYHQYHAWNQQEMTHYREWEDENHHRDRDFRSRSQQQQNEYWQWRHDHYDQQH